MSDDMIEFLEAESNRLLHILGTLIEFLDASAEDGTPAAERSHAVADLERLTRVAAGLRKILAEERAAAGATVEAGTLVDLMLQAADGESTEREAQGEADHHEEQR